MSELKWHNAEMKKKRKKSRQSAGTRRPMSKKTKRYCAAVIVAAVLLVLIIGVICWFLNKESGKTNDKYNLGSGVVIRSVSRDSGPFVEDGSDQEVEDVLQMTVSNTSEEDIQFLRIKAENGDNTAYFDITTLPAGGTVKVQESSAMEYPNWIEECTYSIENLAFFREDRSLYPDMFTVTAQDGWISVENHSSQDITSDIYVYFKNMDDDVFSGGITYRVKFSGGIPAGETAEEQSIHYLSDKSKIMYLTYQ